MSMVAVLPLKDISSADGGDALSQTNDHAKDTHAMIRSGVMPVSRLPTPFLSISRRFTYARRCALRARRLSEFTRSRNRFGRVISELLLSELLPFPKR